MFDIIIFAVIAVFLGIRLFSILGQRDETDDERRSSDSNWIDRAKRYYEKYEVDSKNIAPEDASEKPLKKQTPAHKETAPKSAPAKLQRKSEEKFDLKTDFGKKLENIRKNWPDFRLDEFLQGAEGAFEIILNAFSDGDRKTLKPLLKADIYKLFSNAISMREKQKQTLETTLLGIDSITGHKAEIKGSHIRITVKIISDQINLLRDQAGDILEGDEKEVEKITDFWTFERPVNSSDPAWNLAETEQDNG